MAEKQQGYLAQKRDKDAGHIYFYSDVEHCEDLIKYHRRKLVKATIVIGDERVFTESEVRSLLEAIFHEQERLHIIDGSGGHDIMLAVGIDEIEAAFKGLGIALDPA